MVLAQEKYLFDNPGLTGVEEPTVATDRQGKARLRKRRPAIQLNFGTKCILASVIIGLFFITGIALTLYYILPTRLGYQVVSLENEIQDLEKQQKLLELETAHSRSLGRIESIATNQMAMLPMQDREVFLSVSETGNEPNPNPKQTSGNGQVSGVATIASVNDSNLVEKKVATTVESGSEQSIQGNDRIIQATTSLISGKFIASRGSNVHQAIDD